MKTITTSNLYLPIAATIVTLAFAAPAAAQIDVPFMGSFQGIDTVNLLQHTLTQSVTGTGTLVGHFSSTTALTLTASGGTGPAHWISANGDTIETTVIGSPQHVNMAPCQVVGAQPGDIYLKITEIHTITSGTGRFAGAQGGFILTLYHDTRGGVNGDENMHGTCGSFGTITLTSADH